MRRKLVVGNWKMNGNLAANAVLLSEIVAGLAANAAHPGADCAVCVPAPYLAQCQAQLSGSQVAWGAQDVSAQASGAYTGEVSVAMLQDFGCRYVILGHSERRAYHQEDDALVASKTVAALRAGLTPIVCVGETLAQRDCGQTALVVQAQLGAVLAALAGADGADVAKIVLAYEPVWAIGTGKTATPQMAQDVHALLRTQLAQANAAAGVSVQILYGGSMKPDNAGELMAMPDIDGGLIGGAALKAVDFLAIIRAA